MSLGVLVGHFGELVRLRNREVPAVEVVVAEAVDPVLVGLRDRLGHHLIPLALIARADGDFAAEERAAIVSHCAEIGGLGEAECAVLDAHLAQSRPSLVQLEMALKRLESEAHPHVEALIEAVERVIMADGRIDPGEMRLLEHMRAELTALGG